MAQSQQTTTKTGGRARLTTGVNIGSGDGARYEEGDVIDLDDVPPGARKSWLAQGILVPVKGKGAAGA